MVLWLRLELLTKRGMGSIPDQGTKILNAVKAWPKKKKRFRNAKRISLALRHSRWQGKNRGSPGCEAKLTKKKQESEGHSLFNSSPETEDNGKWSQKSGRNIFYLDLYLSKPSIRSSFKSASQPCLPHHLLQNFSTLSASYSIPATPASFLFLRVFHYLIHIFTITMFIVKMEASWGWGFFVVNFRYAGSSLLCLRFLWLSLVGAAL